MNVKCFFTTRVHSVAAVMVMAASQLACTDAVKFSADAAIATFAPSDLPLEATRDTNWCLALTCR